MALLAVVANTFMLGSSSPCQVQVWVHGQVRVLMLVLVRVHVQVRVRDWCRCKRRCRCRCKRRCRCRCKRRCRCKHRCRCKSRSSSIKRENPETWRIWHLKHGARLAGFHIEDHLVVLLCWESKPSPNLSSPSHTCIHVLDGLIQGCRLQGVLAKGNETLERKMEFTGGGGGGRGGGTKK